MTREQIINRISAINIELSNLHYENKTGSFDMDGKKRTNLSQEWVFLSRKLDDGGCPDCRI